MKVNIIRADGTENILDVEPGTSIMQAALMAGEDGIVGECGGSLMCATCHVFLVADDASDAHWEPPSDDEVELLTCTAVEATVDSRLSCQLIASDEAPNQTVRLPEQQL